MIADLVAEARAVYEDGAVADLAEIVVPDDVVADIADAVQAGLFDLYRTGQREARQERSPGVRLAIEELDPADVAAINEYLGVRGRDVASKLAERFRAEFLREVTAQAQRGSFDAATLVDLLTGLSDRDLRQEVRLLTSEALGLGRRSEQDAEIEGATDAEYSARLDGNTCEVCAALHGEHFVPGSSEYYAAYPPLSDLSRPEDRVCHGRDYCRCLRILTYGPVQEPRG